MLKPSSGDWFKVERFQIQHALEVLALSANRPVRRLNTFASKDSST
jgi:hypothetical protein